MRLSVLAFALALATAGCPDTPTPTTSPPVSVAPPRAWLAEPAEPCGRGVLDLRKREDGRVERVQPLGTASPLRRLRPHALVLGRFVVEGRLTGEVVDDHHCGALPAFHVTSFRPWGAVKRCASIGAANAELLLYTGDLPGDRYVPEDFVDGPDLPALDDDRCVRGDGVCPPGLRAQPGCDGTRWCCPLAVEGTEE